MKKTAFDEDLEFLEYERAKLMAAKEACPDVRKQNPTRSYTSSYVLRSDLVKKNFNTLSYSGMCGNFAVKFTFKANGKEYSGEILGPPFTVVKADWSTKQLIFTDFFRLAMRRKIPEELMGPLVKQTIDQIQYYLKNKYTILNDKNSENRVTKLLNFS